MKKPAAKERENQRAEILAAAEATRQACNKLSREERRRLLQEGLRIINGSDAKATTRSH